MPQLVDRYRPMTIDAFAGIDRAKAILTAFVARPYVSAWLLIGPSGIGKTTIAFATATALGATQELGGGIHHIPARQCDLETIEEIVHRCYFAPMLGSPWNAVIIDEADQMTKPAQLALLSKLDSADPPPNTIWFLTANSTSALEDRFLSRCKKISFTTDNLLEPAVKLLRRAWKAEVKERHTQDRRKRIPEPPDFTAMMRDARMNVREAFNLLEMEILSPGSFVPSLPDPSAGASVTATAMPDRRSKGRVCTIGYSKLRVMDLTEVLNEIGTTVLIDCRTNPQSRQPGYSRAALEKVYGPRYQWAGDKLGGRGSFKEGGIAYVESLIAAGQNCMLMCMEEAPGQCHRHFLIAVALMERGIEVMHIYREELVNAGEVQRCIETNKADYKFTNWRHAAQKEESA